MIANLNRRALIAAFASLSIASQLQALSPAEGSTDHDPFDFGVGSGEPSGTGFVLWTRLAGRQGATLERGPVAVRWEIAADEGFRRVLRSGRFVTGPEVAHSVHVEATGLMPGGAYFYRFHALGATSPVGRAVTLPTVAETLRIAVTCCQHWEQGWFTAYRDIIAQRPDLIVHLGDYIYERSFGTGSLVRRFPDSEPQDLAGYRARHALYKTDRDLQAAHRAHTWLMTWDDHEVSNDYADLANIHEIDPVRFLRRRTAAYQAYFEHMPIRPSRWGSAVNPRLYHRLSWGGLASIYVLDGRSYRDPHACSGPGRRGGRSVAVCEALDDVERTMLGGEQESWLYDSLGEERSLWTLLAQQTMFAPLIRAPRGRPERWTDGWDGYPRARERLGAALRQRAVQNPVLLSGDLHCCFVSDVEEDGIAGRPFATEFLTSCLASRTQGDGPFGDVLANNPHVRFKDTDHSGYIRIDLDRAALRADIRILEDRTDPNAKARSAATLMVRAGQAGAIRT